MFLHKRTYNALWRGMRLTGMGIHLKHSNAKGSGVSIYEAGTVVASETFDVTLSFMSFFESPDNEDGPIVEDIENGK